MSVPVNYLQWRHCIEVDCGIELTPPFIATRLQALASRQTEEAKRFARLYGDAHLRHVIGWFERAQQEMPTG